MKTHQAEEKHAQLPSMQKAKINFRVNQVRKIWPIFHGNRQLTG